MATEKIRPKSVQVITNISSNTLRACSKNHHMRAIETKKLDLFDPVTQEQYRLHSATIITTIEKSQLNTRDRFHCRREPKQETSVLDRRQATSREQDRQPEIQDRSTLVKHC
jgi:hypothetical protein